MVKAVMPIYHHADLLDICGPYEFFKWAGYDITMVAEHPGTITTGNGVEIVVKTSFAQAGDDNDFFWLPGGTPNAIAAQQKSKAMQSFLLDQAKTVQYLVTVCDGALILAQTGLLDGYLATTHWAFLPCFERFAAVKVAGGNPRFVVDRNRITGGGISSGLDEALEVISILSGVGKAQYVQQQVQYYPCPPVGSAIPIATTCPVPGD